MGSHYDPRVVYFLAAIAGVLHKVILSIPAKKRPETSGGQADTENDWGTSPRNLFYIRSFGNKTRNRADKNSRPLPVPNDSIGQTLDNSRNRTC